MAEEAEKVEPKACAEQKPPPVETVEAPKDVAEEKSVLPAPPPPAEERADECKALAVVEKPEADEEKKPVNSIDRDAVLARVATEKRISLIKAWEESEKSKSENKAQKKLSAIGAWENSKKASLEAELKKIEEQLEKKKASTLSKRKTRLLSYTRLQKKRERLPKPKGEKIFSRQRRQRPSTEQLEPVLRNYLVFFKYEKCRLCDMLQKLYLSVNCCYIPFGRLTLILAMFLSVLCGKFGVELFVYSFVLCKFLKIVLS